MNLSDDEQVQSFLNWLDESFRHVAGEVVAELKDRDLQVDSWDSLYKLVYSRFYRDELNKVPLILNANIRSAL